MSRLADLIEELCPDGVEYKPLGEVAELKRGQSITKKSITPGDIPVIAGGRKPAYFTSSANRTGMTIVVAGSGAYAGFVSYWDQPIFVSDAFSVKVNEEILVPRFTYHWVCGKQKELYSLKSGGGVPHVYPKDVAKFKCPIPPLEVQCEIVRILDQFTTLEAELEAELEARRAQYEYYRNQLLSYDALASRGPVEWVKLGEVASKIITGVTPKAADPKYYQDATNPWIRTQDVNFCRINEASAFVTDQAITELPLKWVSPHSVVVAISGASAGRSAILNIRAVTNQHCCNIEINSKLADFRYVYYCIASCYEQLRNLGRGARGDLNVSIIKSFEIPLPTLDEQRYIADILDRFDALVNDISSGLPAEIAARRAQYEYYRDRMLSFPEKK
jgi:hypothetical protein